MSNGRGRAHDRLSFFASGPTAPSRPDTPHPEFSEHLCLIFDRPHRLHQREQNDSPRKAVRYLGWDGEGAMPTDSTMPAGTTDLLKGDHFLANRPSHVRARWAAHPP